MSEKFPLSPESPESHPSMEKPEIENAPSHERANNKHELQEDIENIRRKAELESIKAEDLKVDEQEKDAAKASQPFVDKQLKTMAYTRLLIRARKQLNPLEKPISKFMHQPVIDALSEAAAKSVGRPSGILGGGLAALIGTSIYYYIAKHYGYDYNFFVFIFLLVAGFIAGWLIELLLKLRRNKRD